MEWIEKIEFQPPYHWGGVIAFLKGRAVPGLEVVSADGYHRWVYLGGCQGRIAIRPATEQSFLWIEGPKRLAAWKDEITARARRLFDTDADSAAIDRHLAQDPVLREMIGAHPGLRVPGAWDGFEVAVRAIVGQQISVKAATTMVGRLVTAFGRRIGSASDPAFLFPEPNQLVQAPLETIGLIARRAQTIRCLAQAVEQGRVHLAPGRDLSQVIDQLTAIPGIGPWTANYIAMRAFGLQDAFPAGDLVLRRIMAGPGQRPMTEKILTARAKPWRPYRAYATMYLWTHGHRQDDR